MQHVCGQMRFDGQTLGQELLVKVLASLLAHEDTSAPLVFKRPTGSAHHLENVHDRIVNVPVLLPFVDLDTHDDNHVGGDRQTPRSVLKKGVSEKD